MFTGLIETTGAVDSIAKSGTRTVISIVPQKNWNDLKHGESIAVNGVCLTLENRDSFQLLKFHLLSESLNRSNLGLLKKGDRVNLERALAIGDRLGGHFVSGHIDTTSKICEVCKVESDFVIRITTPKSLYPFLIEKGSITIDGISLTLVEVNNNYFSVNIIPTTLQGTTLEKKVKGDLVNLEGDIIGKYIFHQSNLQIKTTTMTDLQQAGFLG